MPLIDAGDGCQLNVHIDGRDDAPAVADGAASVFKLAWANWHRRLGEIAMEVTGADGLTADAPPYQLGRLQRLFLFSRADTIYGGTNEIQRTILSERVLGLPRESRGSA